MYKLRNALSATGLGMLVSVAASADQAPEHRLPTIEVTAVEEKEASLTSPSKEKAKEELKKVPGATTFIDSDEYRTRPTPAGVADVLNSSPGVFSQSRWGNSEARVLIRGAGTSQTFGSVGVRYLRDGLPLTATDGFTNPELLEPMNALYTEVYRGSNALKYGSAFLGGAVNFAMRNGRNTPGFHTTFITGTHSYVRPQVMVGGVWKDDLDYFVSYTGSYNDSFRDHGREDVSRGYGNLGYRWNEDQETRLHFYVSQNRLQLPGSLTLDQFLQDPYQAQNGVIAPGVNRYLNNYLTVDSQRNLDTLRGDVQHTIRFTPDDILNIGAWYEHRRLWHPLPPGATVTGACAGVANAAGVVSRTFTGANALRCGSILQDYRNLAGGFNLNQQEDAGMSWRYTHDGTLFGLRNSLVFGGFFGYGDTWGQVNNTLPGAVVGTKFYDTKTEAFNIESYFEDRLGLTDTLDLVLGGQFIHAKRHSSNSYVVNPANFSSTPTDVTAWYTTFSPKIGLSWQASDKIQLYGNMSRSYEPPSNGQMAFRGVGQPGNNSPLNAQEATTIEVGTRGAVGIFDWDLAIYHSWVHNELLSTYSQQAATVITGNANDTSHSGVELGTGALIPLGILGNDQLRTRATYTYQRFIYDGDSTYGDNYIPGSPNHFGGLEAIYEHPSGFYIGPNVKMASNYYVDYANTLKARGYTLLGARAGYKSTYGKLGYNLFVEGRNLTNEKWIASTGVTAKATALGTPIFNTGYDQQVFGGFSLDY